jgi:hypothetical protein
MNLTRLSRIGALKTILLGILIFPAVLGAGVQSVPPPGRPTADYATILTRLNETEFVVITYSEDSKAIVADRQWLERLKQLFTAADGKPSSYCFCINYPQIELLTKAGPIATLEVPHGTKLRFFGEEFSGDFMVSPKIAKAIDALAMEQLVNAVTKPNKKKKAPGK